MRDNVVAVTAAGARSAGERAAVAGADKREVALAVMREARAGFLAPSEDESFMAACAALWEIYPDDAGLKQETRAIGDRNKLLGALANGVPVDMEVALEGLTEVPDDALGLLELWQEAK